MKKKDMNRREFLVKTATTGIGVTFATGIIAGCNETKTSSGSDLKTVTIDIAQPENAALANVNGGIKINVEGQDKPVLVTRVSQTEIAAFSSECTHKKCEVDPPSSTGEIKCPCHGATYSIKGAVTKGPAQSDLTQFTATLEGTTVTITI